MLVVRSKLVEKKSRLGRPGLALYFCAPMRRAQLPKSEWPDDDDDDDDATTQRQELRKVSLCDLSAVR